MSLVSFSSVGYQYLSHPDYLFQDVTVDVAAGDRVGLVGPNGAGRRRKKIRKDGYMRQRR